MIQKLGLETKRSLRGSDLYWNRWIFALTMMNFVLKMVNSMQISSDWLEQPGERPGFASKNDEFCMENEMIFVLKMTNFLQPSDGVWQQARKQPSPSQRDLLGFLGFPKPDLRFPLGERLRVFVRRCVWPPGNAAGAWFFVPKPDVFCLKPDVFCLKPDVFCLKPDGFCI